MTTTTLVRTEQQITKAAEYALGFLHSAMPEIVKDYFKPQFKLSADQLMLSFVRESAPGMMQAVDLMYSIYTADHEFGEEQIMSAPALSISATNGEECSMSNFNSTDYLAAFALAMQAASTFGNVVVRQLKQKQA